MKFGVGQSEAGTIGALQEVIGEGCDAIGIGHVDMLVTSQKIFDILYNKEVDREAG